MDRARADKAVSLALYPLQVQRRLTALSNAAQKLPPEVLGGRNRNARGLRAVLASFLGSLMGWEQGHRRLVLLEWMRSKGLPGGR